MGVQNVLRITVFAAIVSTASLGYSQDDSAWINAGIQQAVNTGMPFYQLPAGTINLQNNIIVPPGTKNFALIGAGVNQTILRAPVARTKFIDIGDQIIPHNNWGLTNKPNTSVLTVPEGAASVKLAPGQPAITPGNYVLWDEHRIRNRYGDGDTHNRAEIVRVLFYNVSSRVAMLDQPVGRRFDVSPKLAKYDSALCENITVSGMTLNGLADDGVGSQSLLSANSVRGLNISNLRFVNYSNGAMYVNVCKDTTITNVTIDPATQGGVGAGYGLTVTRSRFTRISNCVANWSQAIKFHTGAMDSIVEDCITTAGGNAIDAHGFDELRVTVRRCTGNGGITLGNEAWAAGGTGHVVQDCNLQFLFIGPNVNKLLVQRCTFVDPLSLSDLDPNACHPNANPRGGIPGDLRFEDTNISGNQNVVNDFVWFNVYRATFIRCKFTTRNTSWGSVIKLAGARGVLQFIQCEFQGAANREAIEIATAGNYLTLVMDRCKIKSSVGLDIGVWLRPNFTGRITLTNNDLVSPGAPSNSVFLKNEANARGSVRNNRVIR